MSGPRCDHGPMRGGGARHAVVTTTLLGALLISLGGCGGPGPAGTGNTHAKSADKAGDEPTRIPGVGDRLQRRIPAASRQVVAVYGDGKDSADATVVLYTRRGSAWDRVRGWSAHNGKRGWTTGHHEGDKRSPVGVFTLSDAGGVLPDPGARLPYTRSAAIAAPAGGPGPTGTTSTTSSPSTTTGPRALRPTTRPGPRVTPKAAASGCTWTTAAVRPPVSACPGRRCGICCARSIRTGIPWW